MVKASTTSKQSGCCSPSRTAVDSIFAKTWNWIVLYQAFLPQVVGVSIIPSTRRDSSVLSKRKWMLLSLLREAGLPQKSPQSKQQITGPERWRDSKHHWLWLSFSFLCDDSRWTPFEAETIQLKGYTVQKCSFTTPQETAGVSNLEHLTHWIFYKVVGSISHDFVIQNVFSKTKIKADGAKFIMIAYYI